MSKAGLVTLTFDLLTLRVVSDRVTCNFGTEIDDLGPSVLELRPMAWDCLSFCLAQCLLGYATSAQRFGFDVFGLKTEIVYIICVNR